MRAVIFDVETTGLPKQRNAPLENTELWPYIVQISWIVIDIIDGEITDIKDNIIKLPEDVTIPEDSIKVHGITNEKMLESGVDIKEILLDFQSDINNSEIIVAHNIEFDQAVIGVESIRNLGFNLFDGYRKNKYCTMKRSRKLCKKWAKLSFLHEKLFKQVPNNLHNSLIDVFVCFRCFYKLHYNRDPLKIKSDAPNTIKFHNVYNQILYKF